MWLFLGGPCEYCSMEIIDVLKLQYFEHRDLITQSRATCNPIYFIVYKRGFFSHIMLLSETIRSSVVASRRHRQHLPMLLAAFHYHVVLTFYSELVHMRRCSSLMIMVSWHMGCMRRQSIYYTDHTFSQLFGSVHAQCVAMNAEVSTMSVFSNGSVPTLLAELEELKSAKSLKACAIEVVLDAGGV